MPKIVITRAAEWANRLRGVGLYLDGKRIGSIANGETKSFDLSPGMHTLEARIDWCSSRLQEFTSSGEEKRYFRLSGFKWGRVIMPLSLVVVVLHILARKLWHIDWIVWLAVPGFLLILWYISFGRKDYLVLRETDGWETD
jgi:hypothetical protein